MIIIHSVQKLLNTSRLKAALYISEPCKEQHLHCWYARLLATGFPGKLLVMYVHEPSLMTIVCQGKTIQGTWNSFRERLGHLLQRFHFTNSFIENEMGQMEGYIVYRTRSKSILAHMNQMVFQLEYQCSRVANYDAIPLDLLENGMMDYLYQYGKRLHNYRSPLDYWKQMPGLLSGKS
jgi:hypothetical protein